MVNSKAWLDGMRAGSEGVPESKNPYRGGQDMQSWFDGWKEGQREAQGYGQKDGQSGAFSG